MTTQAKHYFAVLQSLRDLPYETRKALRTEGETLGWCDQRGVRTYGFNLMVKELSDKTVAESVDHILDLAGLNASAV